MSTFLTTVISLTEAMRAETAEAAKASHERLNELMQEKMAAISAFRSAKWPDERDTALTDALHDLVTAAQDNEATLAAASSGLEALQDEIHTRLVLAADPGSYAPRPGGMPRHAMAASVNSLA